MKYFALASVCLLGLVLGSRAQGPVIQGSETVAKKKTTAPAAADPDSTAAPAAAATTTDPNAAPIPSAYKPKKDTLPQSPTFRSDVLTVTLDVAVLDNKGNPIPKIPQDRFRILEDNTPQKITGFSIGEAPMTICLVIEFSNKFQRLYSVGWQQVLNDSYYFVRTLKPEDYLAVIAYDMRPEILSDFTTDRQMSAEALSRLRIPAFSESNLYDTLVFTGERMQSIEGRKAIVLLSSGVDTFSKLTFDKARRGIQDNGIPIYAIGLLQAQREMGAAMRPGMAGASADMDLTLANNQMKTFALETGGRAFFPRFEGEMPAIFQAVQESMRSEYVLTYQPTNQTKDGKFRKLKVELVGPDNEPFKVTDNKGRPMKLTIVTKQGYKAPREVE